MNHTKAITEQKITERPILCFRIVYEKLNMSPILLLLFAFLAGKRELEIVADTLQFYAALKRGDRDGY